MKKLIIDGNSVYEIDEDCVRRRRPSKDCGIYEHLEGYDGQKGTGKERNMKNFHEKK